jgi:hypothetical protein
MSDSCSDSARALATIMLKLDALNKFDAITWWDIWFCLASASILVLDLIVRYKRDGSDGGESRTQLKELADLAQKHRRKPHMPGTIEKFASIVPELWGMAESMGKNGDTRDEATDIENNEAKLEAGDNNDGNRQGDTVPTAPRQRTAMQQTAQDISAIYPLHHMQSITNSGAYLFADNVSAMRNMVPEPGATASQLGNMPVGSSAANVAGAGPPGAAGVPGSMAAPRFERFSSSSHQNSFMDFSIHNFSEWNWGDLGSLLGGEGTGDSAGAGV